MGNSLRGYFGSLCGGKESKRIAIEESTRSGGKPIDYKPPPHNATPNGKEAPRDLEKNAVEANGAQANHVANHTDSDDLDKSITESPGPKKGSLKGIHKIHEVEHIEPEELNVENIDKVFQNAAEAYGLFVEHAHEFRNAILNFENRFTNANKKTDFEKCFESYLESLEKPDSEKQTGEESDKDGVPMQTLVQNIKTSGDRLLETINTTRPKLDECILEAEKFDVKEHVKDSMKEDEQQTLLSKSVIPANHRKNMKKLKKARKLLDDVSLEAEAILGLISHVVAMAATGKDEEPKKDVLDDTKIEVKVDVNEIHKSSEKDEPKGDKKDEKPAKEEAEQKPFDESSLTDEEKHHEREKGDEITELRAQSPVAGIINRRTDSWERIDNNEDGRLVDYGSFLVLDPTADDDQVLMKRSRSLDSLSSVGSRRSMSRYGSYEFVTNYEIKIAEKNDANRVIMPAQGTKTPPTQGANTPPATVRRMSDPGKAARPKTPVSPTSPRMIYKYTELDSNPLWL